MKKYIEHLTLSSNWVEMRLKETQTKQHERPDVMSHIVKHGIADADSPQGVKGKMLTRQELYSISWLLIIAASETTATILSGAVYFLTRNEAAMQKLHSEIDGAFESYEEISFESTSNLPYLAAVIEETMRIYPMVVGGLNRKISKGGAIIDGKWVPGNASWGVHLERRMCMFWDQYFLCTWLIQSMDIDNCFSAPKLHDSLSKELRASR